MRTITLVQTVIVGLGFSLADIDGAPSPVSQILQLAGRQHGLCLHLGSGSKNQPGLSADLAAQSSLLVHGLALDEESLGRARRASEARGLMGRATVERLPVNPLPYLNDLASLIVIEDWNALAAQGLKMNEVERVVAPGGVICLAKGGRWTKTIKDRSPEMDDWPQPLHGPDGNRVSLDRAVQFPAGLRWQEGMPMNFNLWAATRSWIIANGRVFSLGTTELENLAQVSFGKHKKEEYLTARDAFNGLPLWKVNCETSNDGMALNAGNAMPLVADDQRVYVYKKDQLVALDAATGREVVRFPAKYQTARLLLAQNILVASGWESKALLKGHPSGDLWAPWINKTATGAVEAFEAARGALKWSFPQPAQSLLAADGRAYLLVQAGNPPTNQQVIALDLASGKEQWHVDQTNFTESVALNLTCAGQGVVVVARSKAKSIAILDAANGKLLWEIKGTDKFWTPLVNDELWHSNHKYEIRTGQVKGTLPTSLDGGAIMCTPSAVVGQYVTASRGCAYVDLYPSSEGGTQKGSKRISFAAARGGCIQGATPANGLFYTGQNFCRCSPGQVPGFIAFGPGGKPLEQSDFEQTRPLEKGPAYARPAGPAGPDDWPMHRHDAERSGSAKTAIPAKLKELWQSAATHPAEGPLASAWQARLASCLSSPVVAGGMAYVAATDAGQVIALNAATGKEAWRVTVGGRVDTPPTIHNGRCLFGAHDGWIYALDPKNGQLAWRSRMAPDERRMVAFGQVESVWPAIGSVLVHQGIAYASAGRSTEADGGLAVCAFNPGTGAQKWARQIGPGPVRQNDLLVWRDGKINLHHLQLDPQTGAINTGGTKDENLEGLIDGSWTRMGTRRSGNQKLGRATAEIFAWDTQTVFGYESKSRSYFAMAYTNCMANVTNKLTAKDYLWKVTLPADHQAEAMALGENGLVLAGRIVQPKTQAVTGFLWTTARDNGQKNSEYPLDTAPVYDGLALTAGRVYLTLQNGKVACFTGE